MPCYKPIQAERLENGEITFKKIGGDRMEIPCGQCVGCKLETARQWAGRCENEAQLHKQNCFATLTYNDDKLPRTGSLNKKHLQDFHKRLRYYHQHRYYSAGEYGEQTWRPHYHTILFGWMPEDIELHSITQQGHRLFTSKELDKIWGFGNCQIGAVTFESAGYVARYTMKKITGQAGAMHYVRPNSKGELHQLEPEFSIMSLNPAIGKEWFEKYHPMVTRQDVWIVNGAPGTPPRYYDKLHRRINQKEYDNTKSERQNEAGKHIKDNTWERLTVKETVKKASIKALKRT